MVIPKKTRARHTYARGREKAREREKNSRLVNDIPISLSRVAPRGENNVAQTARSRTSVYVCVCVSLSSINSALVARPTRAREKRRRVCTPGGGLNKMQRRRGEEEDGCEIFRMEKSAWKGEREKVGGKGFGII